MPKVKRTPLHAHIRSIANTIGCSNTTVRKVLAGQADEVTKNQVLIQGIKQCAATFLLADAEHMEAKANELRAMARGLAATATAN